MMVKRVLNLVNHLLGVLDRALAWLVGAMSWLCFVTGNRFVLGCFYKSLESADRLMLYLKRYLGQVRTTLRYRLYYQSLTAQLRAHYRLLKRG